MPKFRDRTCIKCGAVEMNTATHSETCIKCSGAERAEARIAPERKVLEELGYTDISLIGKDAHGKRLWQFTHNCGVSQQWIFPNIRKQLKINPTSTPCSRCGGKKRMAKAMEGYMEKYGYKDLIAYARYCKRVRALSDKIYIEHKAEINPHNLPRGMSTYHLDHKMPIIEGFHRGLEPEFMARKENLQMMSAPDNISKGRRWT